MHQKYWLYCPITVLHVAQHFASCFSEDICTCFPLRSRPVVFAKTTSAIVVFFCICIHTPALAYITLSILWLCVRVRKAVFICLCVCLILICFYIPSLYAALHLFCFFLPPLRRVPLCWLETSLITHRENLVCFRFRWMVVWVNGWMDGQGWEEKR